VCFATRHREAVIGGPRADDRAPYYHDHCWPVDAQGFAMRDAQGRVVVWLGRGNCGYTNEHCAWCEEPL